MKSTCFINTNKSLPDALKQVDSIPSIRNLNPVRMKRCLVFPVFFLFCINLLFAQRVVEGYVIDTDGQRIPGVSVTEKGSVNGTVTDADGYFRIEVKKEAVLVFSFAGMATIEYAVRSSRITLDILSGEVKEFPEEYERASRDEAVPDDEPIPEFEFPPPKPSSRYVFERTRFENCKRLKDVDAALSRALIENGYSEKSYFSVPNGFALVTRIEKINKDGTSVSSADRWNVDITNIDLNIANYLKILFFGYKGFYRVIVFIVTDKSFKSSSDTADRKEALAWVDEGNLTLPEFIGNKKFSRRHYVASLVYEFTKNETDDPVQNDPGSLTGEIHLTKANILPWIPVPTNP